MPRYKVCQSPRLSGEVRVSTSKNAVLPILAAALLTQEETLIHQTPHLTDVTHMLEILRACGAEAELEGDTARVRAVSVGSPGATAPLRAMRARVPPPSRRAPHALPP